MEIHPKIIVSIDQMISDGMFRMYFYGGFCQFINFKNDDSIPTCGVNVDLNGMNFYFNNEFLDSLTQEEVNFIMLHEIFHLLWDHQSRIRRFGYEQDLSNIVQDMIINTIISVDIIQKNKKDFKDVVFAKIPTDKSGKIYVYMKPIEYKEQLIFEDLYEWMIKKRDIFNKWKDNKVGDCPVSDYLRKIFEDLENNEVLILDEHLLSDVPDEYKKDLVVNINAILASRGLIDADIEKILDKLKKSRKDYLKEIKLSSNELFGYGREMTITKRNRRSIVGLKGKRRISHELIVILDTSGSMAGYFNKALSYIFQNDIKINLIQVDEKVRSVNIIKNKKQLQKMMIKGLCGTNINPGVEHIKNDKKLKKLNLLILTDGYMNPINFRGYNGKVLILSRGKKCYYDNSKKVKQILIKD